MTREEAIKELRGFIGQLTEGCQEAIKVLIPELKESDDEWIRKFLVELVSNDKENNYRGLYENWKIDFDNVLAWLEKQKEQTVYKNSKSEIDFADKYSHDVWEKLMSKFNSIEGYSIGCNDVSDIVLNAVLNAFKWEREQKPSINIDQLKSLMLQYLQEAANEKDDADIEADTDKWARKILGYNFKQKQIEWTELTWKDIVELEGIINNVHYDFSAGIGQESFGKEVLERFRLTKGIEYLDEAEQKYWQKEQKPAEWGEEDKNKLHQVMEILLADKTIALRENPHCKALHRAYDELLDWFKSLPERFSLQPKQEWGDGDLQDRNWVLGRI
jgi:hypothetical protein